MDSSVNLYIHTQVCVGESLKFTVGSIQYHTSDSSNIFLSLSLIIPTSIIIIVVITLPLIILTCVVVWYRRKHHSSSDDAISASDVVMYSSPAYGTHQVFSEPGLDHLYESIDDYQLPQQGNNDNQESVDELREAAVVSTMAEVASSDSASQYSTCTVAGFAGDHDNEHGHNDDESLTGYVNDMCSDGKAEYLELLDGKEETPEQSVDGDSDELQQ